MSPTAGERFGPWTVRDVRPIAGGGYDARAEDAEGREVCLWIGAEGVSAEAPAVEEIRPRLARIYHSTLPRVLATEVVDGRAVIAVQAYSGRTLAERVADGPLDAPAALDVARGVAAGLVKAHRAGVAHGAVTPDEILLADDGRTLLLHLGLGGFLGPRPVRAPEDEEERGTETADVFGLSRSLVHALEGEDPLERAGVPPSAWEGRTPESFDSGLPEGLRRLLSRALLPDRARRLRHAEELSGDLGVIRASWDTMTAPPPRATVPFPGVGRLVVVGVVLALLAALVASRAC